MLDLFRRDRKEEFWDETATSDRPATVSEDITSPAGRETSKVPTRRSEPTTGDAAYAEIGAADRERAAAALQNFLEENATNVERAVRTRAQADRLEAEGIPSDSAQNRATRAREEVVQSLVRLQRSLYASGEPRAAQALELEIENLNPPIASEELRR